MNSTPSFQVIRGGLSDSFMTSKRIFVSAHISNTRLMGSMGLRICWHLPENQVRPYFFQFFYLDIEEFGIDTYESVLSSGIDDDESYATMEDYYTSIFGGLGGSLVEISENEVCYLLQQFSQVNEKSKNPLPGAVDEYSFLLEKSIHLSDEDSKDFMQKQCTKISSPYQVINYFLMRCFAKDFSAAKFLTKGYVRTNLHPSLASASLLYNAIDETPIGNDGSHTNYHTTNSDDEFGTFKTLKSYLCESLLEINEHFYMIISQVTLDHLSVVKYEKISIFQVSSLEASMITCRPEYITVFEYFGDSTELKRGFTDLSKNSIVTNHESGRVFMLFYPHNDHVTNPIYRLCDDVAGVLYVSDYGQILLVAYSEKMLQFLEKDMGTFASVEQIVPIAKYQFEKPVLYDFIHSDFEDFQDYVDAISIPMDSESNPEDDD